MTLIAKTCRQNKDHQFIITDDDMKFYEKMDVPLPTLCPDCRQQRRLAWRGERKLYNRKCDLCGKQIVSPFAPDKPYKVYCRDCWWSDKWDSTRFGRDFDFNRPFFDQFCDLLREVPLLFSWNIYSENSEYNNNVSYLKNCYLLSSSNYNEDCYYGYFVNDSKNCVDCISTKKSELCYECVECLRSYNCKYCQNCIECRDSFFLQNCIGCNDCFGCINMRHKQYCFLDQQLSKEDYIAKIKAFKSGDRSEVQKVTQVIKDHHLKYPYKYMVGDQNENTTGNAIYQSKNANFCFDCIQVEDCKYCYQLQEAKDCMDIMTWGRPGELLYECMATGEHAYSNRFTITTQGSSYNSYCLMCMFSKYMFGCVSVNHKEYCILNKQYSQEEYENLVKKITEHMKKTREWGEFFPIAISTFAYNESVASDFLPLTKEEAIKLGVNWREEDIQNKYEGPKITVPNTIQEITDDITKQILECENCHKNYKIIRQELQFYREQRLPPPILCPECRHRKRIKLKNPRHLWTRECMKCKTPLQTTFAPGRPEIVYCERCYNESIY